VIYATKARLRIKFDLNNLKLLSSNPIVSSAVILYVVQVDHLEFLVVHKWFHKSMIKRSSKLYPYCIINLVSPF